MAWTHPVLISSCCAGATTPRRPPLSWRVTSSVARRRRGKETKRLKPNLRRGDITVTEDGVWSSSARSKVRSALAAGSAHTTLAAHAASTAHITTRSGAVKIPPSQRASNALQHLLHCIHAEAVALATPSATSTHEAARRLPISIAPIRRSRSSAPIIVPKDPTQRRVWKRISRSGAFRRLEDRFDAPPSTTTTTTTATTTPDTTAVVKTHFYILESKHKPPNWKSSSGTTDEGETFGVLFGDDMQLWRTFLDHPSEKAFFVPKCTHP